MITTASAVSQRVPPRQRLAAGAFSAHVGAVVSPEEIEAYAQMNGYGRASTVRAAGDYAMRGGVLDIFAPGAAEPLRFDFFGDQLETIRAFDAETQRSTRQIVQATLTPVSEILFDADTISQFRRTFAQSYGAVSDLVYDSVSARIRRQGVEQWLPFFYERLETVFDYVGDSALIGFEHLAEDSRRERVEQAQEHYDSRANAPVPRGSPPFRAPAPASLYLQDADWEAALAARPTRRFNPFDTPVGASISLGARTGRNFAPERNQVDANVFDAARQHINDEIAAGKRVLFGAWTDGSAERLAHVLGDHGLADATLTPNWPEGLKVPAKRPLIAVLPLEQGFETDTIAVLSEQDLLGDRLARPRRKRKASSLIAEAAALSPGDLVVHSDHGVARYEGLKTLDVQGAPHDCLDLSYHGGDKLYLPVENIELVSRYGSEDVSAQLDKLGGVAWQSRKARAKQRLRDMAEELIRVAAARAARSAEAIEPNVGMFDEFCARFPYEETEDQLAAIEDAIGDLGSGKPMDRLICGDVGFGKTEVALRAAFIVAMTGKQVAIVAPTTLLCRQHLRTFQERFHGLPVKIRQLSRLVTTKEANETKQMIADGTCDIVIGTHALLGKGIAFRDLGLLVIDEEQHFGVKHKERLKELRADVHVLTLSATPIPRTLQLALTGVRELSLITTPPVDRLAVRTYISPFDPVILKEALRRERYRGGQTYYVCPRLADLDEVAEFLAEAAPELRIARAHGQLPPTELEDIMTGFYEGRYDVLLSTAIVESGLDVPNANTLIVHRADMFGLAQLYQLRGRVGRSKIRAYAYFTTPANKTLTEGADKRLKVLHSLDQLGAGFSLASHDLDIRGGGNLLGEEQSGHIREVGFELYQSMLEDAVSKLKGGDFNDGDTWSPQISIGTSVLIPDTYVADLPLRLTLYRRLSGLETRAEIDDFAAELVDRFGPLPEEVTHLMDVMEIKALCRTAHIGQLDAGTKGAVIAFHKKTFPNPPGLVDLVAKSRGAVKIQPDQKVVFRGDWDMPDARLKGVRDLAQRLATLATAVAKKAA